MVSFEMLDTCIQCILDIGVGCLVAKADLEDAFRIIHISPLDYHLLGFTFSILNGAFPRASAWRVLPLKRSLLCSAVDTHQHLSSYQHESHSRSLFKPCYSQFDGSAVKTVLPTTTVILHGIEVHTCSQTMELSLVERLGVIDTLTFACRVIAPESTFLTVGVTNQLHSIRLTCEASCGLASCHAIFQWHHVFPSGRLDRVRCSAPGLRRKRFRYWGCVLQCMDTGPPVDVAGRPHISKRKKEVLELLMVVFSYNHIHHDNGNAVAIEHEKCMKTCVCHQSMSVCYGQAAKKETLLNTELLIADSGVSTAVQ